MGCASAYALIAPNRYHIYRHAGPRVSRPPYVKVSKQTGHMTHCTQPAQGRFFPPTRDQSLLLLHQGPQVRRTAERCEGVRFHDGVVWLKAVAPARQALDPAQLSMMLWAEAQTTFVERRSTDLGSQKKYCGVTTH